jgi:hypothetical protein
MNGAQIHTNQHILTGRWMVCFSGGNASGIESFAGLAIPHPHSI